MKAVSVDLRGVTEGTAPAGDRAIEERLFTGYSGRLLWVTALGGMLTVLGQFVFPLLLPTIIDEFAISTSQGGFLVTTIWLFTGLSRYPGGRLADQLSRKTVLAGAVGLSIVGLVGFALGTSYWLFIASAVVLGTGIGLYFPAALAQISDLFVARRGQAMGIHIGWINIGGAVAAGLVIAVLAVAPWRTTFLPLIAGLAIVGGLMHVWNAQRYVFDMDRVSMDALATVRRLGRRPGVPWVIALLSLFNVVFQGFVNFLPTFLQVEKGFDPSLASAAFAAFFVVGAVANPIAGRLGDRLRYPYVAAGAAAITALGLSVIISTETVGRVVLGVLVIGAGGAALWPVMTAFLMDRLPSDSMGGDFGALSTIYLLLGSTGPAYVGLVAERADYTTAFATLVGGLLLAVIVALWLSYAH